MKENIDIFMAELKNGFDVGKVSIVDTFKFTGYEINASNHCHSVAEEHTELSLTG